MMKNIKSYPELIRLKTYDERLKYLFCNSSVGLLTFAQDRCFNQMFYHSIEWQRVRRDVILRDNGCDLAIQELPIIGKIYVHHINVITMEDLNRSDSKLFDLDNLICCSFGTHNSIHYGRLSNIPDLIERRPNDTSPWLQIKEVQNG